MINYETFARFFEYRQEKNLEKEFIKVFQRYDKNFDEKWKEAKGDLK